MYVCCIYVVEGCCLPMLLGWTPFFFFFFFRSFYMLSACVLYTCISWAVSSSNAVYHISGAGIYANRAAPQFDDRPIVNNGLILSASNGTSVNFISNSSQSGVGVVTGLDGRTWPANTSLGVWRVTNPYGRPGALRLVTKSWSSSLPTRSQGIYTGTIPDSNNNTFVFNVGLYPSGFNGKLLIFTSVLHLCPLLYNSGSHHFRPNLQWYTSYSDLWVSHSPQSTHPMQEITHVCVHYSHQQKEKRMWWIPQCHTLSLSEVSTWNCTM